MSYYSNKIAIVTGGGAGIGRGLCQRLAAQGAKSVIVADLNMDCAEQTADSIRRAGTQACAVQVDVSDEQQVEGLVSRVVKDHGCLDLMFNNAGISIFGEMRDISLEHWRRIIDVDLWGVIYGTHYAYLQMVKQGAGHIVNTASAAGLWPSPLTTPYAAAKHGVVGLSTSLRAEAKPMGVRVSVICPGFIQTEIFDTMPSVSPLVEGGKEALASSQNIQKMSVEECSRIILNGIARNRAIIPVTTLVEVGWRMYRLAPSLLDPALDKFVSNFRQYRNPAEG